MVGGGALTEPLTLLWLELLKVRREGWVVGVACSSLALGAPGLGGGQQPWKVLEPEVIEVVGLHFCGLPLRGYRPRSVACLFVVLL